MAFDCDNIDKIYEFSKLLSIKEIKLSAWSQNEDKELLALYIGNGDFVFCCFTDEEPIIKQVPWFSDREHNPVSICFNPLGTFLLVLSHNGHLYIVPTLPLFNSAVKTDQFFDVNDLTLITYPFPMKVPKQLKTKTKSPNSSLSIKSNHSSHSSSPSSSSSDTCKRVHSSSISSNTVETKTSENCLKLKDAKLVKTEIEPTVVTWWQSSYNSKPTAIIGTRLGEIIFVDLYNGVKTSETTVNGCIKSLSVCQDGNRDGLEPSFLLITLENKVQYKIILEHKDMNNRDYNTGSDDNENVDDSNLGQFGKGMNLPAARSRLQGLKQLSVEKIATLKQKLAESRFKATIKEDISDESSPKVSNFEPDYVWGKVNDVILSPQVFSNKFLLAGYHPATQFLSVHTMGLNAIPLCTYKMPLDVEDVLLCDSVIFTVSTNRTVFRVVSSRMSQIKNICWEFNVDSIMGKLDLSKCNPDEVCEVGKESSFDVSRKPDLIPPEEHNENLEKIIAIYRRRARKEPSDVADAYPCDRSSELSYQLENCIVVTSRSIYVVERRSSAVKIALDWILKANDLEKVEKLCAIFQMNVGVLLELAGDIKLAASDINKAFSFYRISKCGSLKVAVKLSAAGHCDQLLKYSVPLMMDSSFNDLTTTERIHLSNLVLMAYTQQMLSVVNDTEMTKAFLQFLESNPYYDGILAVSVTGQSFLFRCLHKLMIHKGLIIDGYNVLIKLMKRFLDNKSLQWTIDKDDFWRCLTENCLIEAMIFRTATLPIYAEYVIQNAELMNLEHLDRLLVLTDPTSFYVRSVAHVSDGLDESFIDNDETEGAFPFPKLVELFLIALLVKISRFKDEDGFKRALLLPVSDVSGKAEPSAIESKDESFESGESVSEHIWPIRKDFKKNEMAKRKRDSVLSCGFGHSALIRNGAVYTWGQTVKGCLGHGLTMSKMSPPQPISWFSSFRLEVTIVSCGKQHTVALTNNGLYAWGCSAYGQLGLGPVNESPHPRLVSTLANENIISVKCGQYHTLALTGQGSVFAWGWGVHGQLGLGTIEDERIPKYVDTLKEKVIVDIAAGHGHSLVLSDNGHVYSFGSNVCGQLGTGSVVKSSTPTLVKGISGRVVTIATGYFHSLAVTESNVVYTWGISPLSLRRRRQRMMEKTNAGSPTTEGESCEQDEVNGDDVTEVNPPAETHLSPTVVNTDDVTEKIIQVCCGCHHSLLVTDSGSLYAWGRSVSPMGNVSVREVVRPTLFTFNDIKVDAVACGCEFTTVQDRQTGKIFTWGSNSVGQLGVPVDESATKCLDGKLVMLKSCKRTIRIPPSLTASFLSPREVPDIPSSSFTYQTLKRPSSLDSFSLSRADPDGYSFHCLHLAIQKYRQIYNINVVLKKCIELGNYQAASKIALLESKFKQSMIYQLKGLQSLRRYHPKTLTSYERQEPEGRRSPRSEVATPDSEIHFFADQGGQEELCDASDSEENSPKDVDVGEKSQPVTNGPQDNRLNHIRTEYIDHAKFILETYLNLCSSQNLREPNVHAILETGIQFWTAEKLPLTALENFLLEKLDLIYYDLGYLLFCQLKRDNQGPILQQFSSSFLLRITSKLLSHVEKNGSCIEYVETMSKIILNDGPIESRRSQCLGRREQVNRKSEAFMEAIADKLKKKSSVGGDSFVIVPASQVASVRGFYFSCGHRHSEKSLFDEFKVFERILDEPVTDKLVKLYSIMDETKAADISCPSCVYSYIRQ